MVQKDKVQTTILYSINFVYTIQFRKKIPSPLLKTIFGGQFLCPGGSSLKKRGANVNIGLNQKHFIINCHFRKKIPRPLLNIVFRGHILCPGGSPLKKDVLTSILGSIKSILLLIVISEKKFPGPS